MPTGTTTRDAASMSPPTASPACRPGPPHWQALRRYAVLALCALAAGCMTVSPREPQRFAWHYLGSEPTEGGRTCAGNLDYLWLRGPGGVNLRILVPQNIEGAASLEMRLVAPDDLPVALATTEIVTRPLGGAGQPHRHPLTSVQSHRLRTGGSAFQRIDAVAPLGELPATGFRLTLPGLRIGTQHWQPADLELRPAQPTERPLPLDC